MFPHSTTWPATHSVGENASNYSIEHATIANNTIINGKKNKKDSRTGDGMIDGRRQVTVSGKEHHNLASTHWGTSRSLHRKWRSTRWSARRKRDAWTVLCMLLLGLGTIIILSSGSLHMWGQVRVAQSGISSARRTLASPTGGLPVSHATVTVRPARARIYPFPSSNEIGRASCRERV